MGGYYTYDEIVEHLFEINSQYPELTELILIGNTLENRDVWAIKLNNNTDSDEDEPEVLYTGLHHAREPMSYMNLFYYMQWLLENYQSDSACPFSPEQTSGSGLTDPVVPLNDHSR